MSIKRFVNLLVVVSLFATQSLSCRCQPTPAPVTETPPPTEAPLPTETPPETETPPSTETPIPDEGVEAPPLDMTVATDICTATEFLYTGEGAVQTGVESETIDCQQVAVLRGRILDVNNNTLLGVTITILNHPEFGQTESREDGMFDLAVNGGGQLTVNYRKDGYLPSQRKVQAPWQDYAWLPDVVLIEPDKATKINLSQTDEEMLFVQGSEVVDEDGIRQATLLFPKGVEAWMVLPNDTTQPLTTIDVRATEFTVGDNGPQAMPAELPQNTGYTFAAEFSVDEALSAGATDVVFSQSLYFYQQDFIGFPVGSAVPTGYYDRDQGQWIPSENGRVVELLAITDGLAELDTDGDGIADNGDVSVNALALEISAAERAKLAELYQMLPVRLWRVPIQHFTPWDCNWPYGPPDDATGPNGDDPDYDNPDDNPCERGGSIVECQNQVLGESVQVVGTPFSLNYRSNRVPGYQAAYTLVIPLSGNSIPSSLEKIRLEISVANRRITKEFEPTTNKKFTFVWDGKDDHNRVLQGSQTISVDIGYVYEPVYYPVSSDLEATFGRITDSMAGMSISGSRRSNEIVIWKKWKGSIGLWDTHAEGLGGWSFDIHHAVDPVTNRLIFGNGSTRSTQSIGATIQTVYRDDVLFSYIGGVEQAPNGDIYIANAARNRIFRLELDGTRSVIAGKCEGCKGFYGDGGLAIDAWLDSPGDISLAANGGIYIADTNNNRVRFVGQDGIISTIAGNGTTCSAFETCGDGGPATQAALGYVSGVTTALDGSLYISTSNRIRRVGLDGIIYTVAGGGDPWVLGDGLLAVQASLIDAKDVVLAMDGSLYIAERGRHRIRKVDTDGIISTVVGTGEHGYNGDAIMATDAMLNNPVDVELGPDGSLFIADRENFRVRRVGADGIIYTVAGTGDICPNKENCGEDGLAYVADLNRIASLDYQNSGNLIVAINSNESIRLIKSASVQFSLSELFIPSPTGPTIFHFDNLGRHLHTLHSLTGATLYTFGYDSTGQLVTLTDSDGNVTTIERNSDGDPVAVVSPYGQRTALALDENGYLASITNPAGEAWQFEYTEDGLLTQSTQPGGQVSNYGYDDMGRLIRAEDPAGGYKTLARTRLDHNEDRQSGYEVTLTTAMGRTTTYRVEQLNIGSHRITNTFPDGTSNQLIQSPDGTRTVQYGDGTLVTEVEGPDPRWGMLSPWVTSIEIQTPQGLHFASQSTRTAELDNPEDVFSLKKLTTTTIINGRTYTSEYDATLRQATRITPEGRKVVTTIDEYGRNTGYQIANMEPVSISYDTYGRVETFAIGEGSEARIYRLTYDSLGNLQSYTDPLERSWIIEYNNAGRITRISLPGDRKVNYTYDLNGKVLTLTPPDRPAHAFTYTPDGKTETYNPPDVNLDQDLTQFTYNQDGQITKLIRPDGENIVFKYQDSGKRESVTLPDGLINYTFDPFTGQLIGVNSPDGLDLNFDYDGGFLLKESWSGSVTGSVEHKFNNDLWIQEESINSEQVINFQYDQDGLLTQIGEIELIHNLESGLIERTTLGSLSTNQSYNSFGEPQTIIAKFGDNILYSVAYERDLLGRVTQMSETIQGMTHTFTYYFDIAGQLIEVRKDGNPIGTYTYDLNGNRLSYSGQRGDFNGMYDAQDRLDPYGQISFAYTANGELYTRKENGQITTYAYDVSGNLDNFFLPNGTEINYLFDARNRLIGKKVNEVLVQAFLYRDLINPVAELDGSGNVVSRFVYGSNPLTPDYMLKDGKIYRFLTDSLGSVRIVVNVSNGEIVQRIDYDEFGVVLADTNPGFQPFGYVGGIYDRDSLLTHFGFRDYDATTGRWTVKDPIGFDSGDSNWYHYTNNDPINRIDPLGLHADPCGQVNWSNLSLQEMNAQIERLKSEMDRAAEEYESYKPEFDKWWEHYKRTRIPKNTPFWDIVANLVAGFGDQLFTIPFTGIGPSIILRKLIGYGDGVIDKSSDWYQGGAAYGTAWDWAMTGMQAVTPKGISTDDLLDIFDDLTSGEE